MLWLCSLRLCSLRLCSLRLCHLRLCSPLYSLPPLATAILATVLAIPLSSPCSPLYYLYSLPPYLPGAGGGRLTLASGTLSPGGYDEAFAGVDGVVHTVAVVEVLDNTDAENRILRPALDGTR